MTLKSDAKFKEKLTCCLENDMRNLQLFTRATESVKIGTLMDKFNHNFDDCVNPFCICSLEPESTSHFFLHYHRYNAIRSILFEDLNSADKNLFKLSDNELTLIILYGSTKYSLMNNRILLNSSVKYIENSKRSLGLYFSAVVFFLKCH